MKKYIRPSILAGLSFGLGSALAIFIAYLINSLDLVVFISGIAPDNQLFVRLLFAIFLVLFALILLGAVKGAIGAFGLTKIQEIVDPKRFIIKFSISFAVTEAIVTIPFIILTSIFLFYNPAIERNPEDVFFLVITYSLVYGIIVSLLLGLLLKGLRGFWKMLPFTLIGFLLGGIILGLILTGRPLVSEGGKEISIIVFIQIAYTILLIFAGAGIGVSLTKFSKKEEKLFNIELSPRAKKFTKVILNIGVFLIIIVIALNLVNFIKFIIIRDADLSSQLSINTELTHWGKEKNLPLTGKYKNELSKLTSENSSKFKNHTIECVNNENLIYTSPENEESYFNQEYCLGRPSLGEDSDGNIHIVYYANKSKVSDSSLKNTNVIKEIVQSDSDWSEPAIIFKLSKETTPILTTTKNKELKLNWVIDKDRFNSEYIPYKCDSKPKGEIAQAMFESLVSNDFYKDVTKYPYCQNQYDSIHYLPNPEPEFSDEGKTEQGAFSRVHNDIESTEYEVLFATMEYQKDIKLDSPGAGLSASVASLYENVKSNPENYPKGMKVKILLGNYPDVSQFVIGEQIWNAIDDLRAAGIDQLVDEEIGWEVEVANFNGTWPHSHSKFIVIDGRKVIAGGFNYSYLHLDTDFYPEEGYDMLDLGIEVIGPIAQASITAYDELWKDANKVICTNLHPRIDRLWKQTCYQTKAEVSHPVEALRFFVPEEATETAFSLFRNENFKEGDELIKTAILSANESIDMMEVNFSLEIICDIEVIYDGICDFSKALPYMKALLENMEENGTKVRVLVEKTNMNGLENSIAIRLFQQELEKRGMLDQFEARFYEGKMHPKSLIIDNQVVIIGSQNMHYSAWGDSGLTEYSIGVVSTEAAEDYSKTFEYYWNQGQPVNFLEQDIEVQQGEK